MVAFNMEGTLIKNRNSWNSVMNALSQNPYFNINYSFNYLYSNLNNKININMNNNELNDIIINSFNYQAIYEGIDDTIDLLHQNGIKAIIITTGVKQYAKLMSKQYSFDGYIGNEIKSVNGKIKFIQNIDPLKKGAILNKIRMKRGYRKDNILSIGSSIMDLSMKSSSGKFIAFNPDSNEVKRCADLEVESNSVYDIFNLKMIA